MIIAPRSKLFVLSALVFALISGAAGHRWASRTGALNLMQCEQTHLKMLKDAQETANQRIRNAYFASNRTIGEALIRAQEAEKKNKEIQDELNKHTTGRDCLSADARRVLQQSPAFARQSMPQATGGAASAAAAAATDSLDRHSTDADIALWASEAGTLYEQCRARLDALRDWDQALNGRDRENPGTH